MADFAATCDVPADLALPPLLAGAPGPGRRVRVQLPAYAGSQVFHILRLPDDWCPGQRWPVLCEYPGNGPYLDANGDHSSGYQEDACFGYGLSGSTRCISMVLPCVDPVAGVHVRSWWGDPEATTAYCRAAVADVVARFAGDPKCMVLCGFSRGGIACNYLGLRDDATARLWRAFASTSHYDGVCPWPHADGNPAAALIRLGRLAGRPQLICHEQPDGTAPIRRFLAGSGEPVAVTTLDLPWPNHTAAWVLHDLPVRAQARQWLSQIL